MKTLQINKAEDETLYRPVMGIYGLDIDEVDIIKSCQSEAFTRSTKCFSKIRDPYYNMDAVCPYHSGQYLTYLYFLGNTIFNTYLSKGQENQAAQNACDKIFMTSLTINGADIYYAHKMPDIFYPAHPLGAVLTGKATIGDYFFFMQGCNLGINKGVGPSLGSGVVMWGGSKIVGNCHIGNNVMLGANAYIKDMDVPDNSIVYGQYPNVIIKENREDEVKSMLNERFIMN